MTRDDSMLISQDLLDILFERMPMGLAILDRDLILRRSNPTWADFIARYTRTPIGQVVPGARFLDFAPGTEATTVARYRKALAGQTVREEAVPMVSKGITSYWDVVLTPLLRNGEVVGILDVTTDATERKQAEQVLRGREEELRRHRDSLEETIHTRTAELTRLNEELQREIVERQRAEGELKGERNFISAVLETAGALITVLDCEGRIVRFNRACEELSGYAHDEVEGRFLWDLLLVPEEVQTVRALFTAVQEGRFPNQGENRWVTKSGLTRLVAWSNTAILGGNGAVRYIVGIGIDITEQRRTEEALRSSEEEYRELAENANSIILRMTSQGEVTYFNEFAQAFFGYDQEEIVGRNVVGTIVPAADTSGRDLVAKMEDLGQHTERYITTENENMRRNGERVWVAWTNRAIPDANGRAAEVLCVGIDITDRKKAEEALARARDELSSLLEVSHKVASTLELQPLLDVILEQLRLIVDYTGATVFALDGEVLTVLAHQGPLTTEEIAQHRFFVRGDLVNREVILRKKPVIIGDVLGDTPMAQAFRQTAAERINSTYSYIRSWIGVPLMVKDRVIGALTLDHSEPDHYTTRHAELALAFANQVAVAIENASLYEETWRRADELRTLFSVQQAITSRLDLDAVLQLVADEARRLTSAQRTAVFLLEGDDLCLSVRSGDDTPGLLGYRMPVGGSLTGAALHTGAPVRVGDAESEPGVFADIIRRAGVKSFISVPMLSGTQPIGAIAVVDKLSGTFGPEDERVLSMLASGAVVGLENARLYRQEQERLHEAEQRRRVAEGLRDILAILNSDRSLSEILDYMLDRACRLLGTNAGALYRLQADKGILTIQAARGLPADYVTDISIPVGQGIVGRAVMEHRPIVASDLGGGIPVDAGQDPRHSANPTWLVDHYRSAVAVPLIGKDEIYGCIVLYYPEPRQLAEEELELAVSFADQAALAIANARLRVQAEETAVAAERSRLARDLHDAVTQTLFSASLIAEVLPRLWDRNPDDGHRRLEELRQLTRGALAEMRTLLHELRPATLIEAGIDDLLRQLTEATIGRARVPVTLDLEGHCHLPPDVQVALYRIAQEALNNVAKHSGASQATVSLQCRLDLVELHVRDNGRGFDRRLITGDHLGLGIMEERAQAIGAHLRIESRVGGGTEVVVSWRSPVQEGSS